MDGCSLFFVFCVAAAALATALFTLTKLRQSRESNEHLEQEVQTLWTTIRHMRAEAAALASRMAEADAGTPEGSTPVETVATSITQTLALAPSSETRTRPEERAEWQVSSTAAASAEAELAGSEQPSVPLSPAEQQPPPIPEGAASPPPSVEPPPPPPPYAPPFHQAPASAAWRVDWENLVGIKLFSWIAGVALVLAAVFFLKYSVDHGWLSPTVRATLGILTGIALIVSCERRVARGYAFTANAMHGAGIAILYATLFAVHALWHLVPPGPVFLLMLVVTAVAVALSVRRDSMFIALLGLMGGFATPALLSSGQNRPVGLFSYLLMLSAGLGWVAYRKRWPVLMLGSTVFTVLYQWGWVSTYLTPAQLPVAAAIFLVFAGCAAAALWIGRRESDDGQRMFDRVALAATALPLAFGVFAAAVPAYGARIHTLFGFLLLIAAGLAFIAEARSRPWMHVVAGGAVVFTFIVWTSRSYVSTAWPAILGWIAAFIVLQLIVQVRSGSQAGLTASLLFFVLPALVWLEPRTASPQLLFGMFFLLLVATAWVAQRAQRASLYFVAVALSIAGLIAWTAAHLHATRSGSALALYGSYGLLLLAAPVFLTRLRRGFASHLVVVAHLLLMYLGSRGELSLPPWSLFAVLIVLGLAISAASLRLRRGSLLAVGAVATQLVLIFWRAAAPAAPSPQIALMATLVVAAWALATLEIASRLRGITTERLPSFQNAAILALLSGHFVAIVAGGRAGQTLFGSLLATHVVLALSTLALAWSTERHALALWSMGLFALATASARTSSPIQAFLFALAPYLIYVGYPLLLGARARRSLEPHLGAVLASAFFFLFAREAMEDGGLGYMIGVLPVGQAIVLAIVLYRLLRTEDPGNREQGRLALVAAAVLAFITVAIPLQLDRQWITVAWALEGAALVWLHRRIPHQGLLAWAGALLTAVFVRLVFNPAVYTYQPPSEVAIFNWYLYTYAVCAAASFAAAWWLPLARKRAIGVASAMGTVLLFMLLNIEIADYFADGQVLAFNLFSASLAQDLTYTIGWALFAIAMLVAGLILRARPARVAALALLLVTILKCFLHDLARLGGLYRIASLLGLALSLVLVGVLLQKFVMRRSDETQADPAPAPIVEEPSV